MYQREHDLLFDSIRKGKPMNDGKRMTTDGAERVADREELSAQRRVGMREATTVAGDLGVGAVVDLRRCRGAGWEDRHRAVRPVGAGELHHLVVMALVAETGRHFTEQDHKHIPPVFNR